MAKGVDNNIHTDKAGQPIYWNAIAMIVSRFDIHTLGDPINPRWWWVQFWEENRDFAFGLI